MHANAYRIEHPQLIQYWARSTSCPELRFPIHSPGRPRECFDCCNGSAHEVTSLFMWPLLVGRRVTDARAAFPCWSDQNQSSSRRAMQAFIERVNAALPIDQPDGILLTLVQSHPDKVCGTPCPVGQGLSPTGQCVP